MPDTYDHKPSADELLHDLARVTDAGGGLLFNAGTTPEGPVERVTSAVSEYMVSPDWGDVSPTPDTYNHLMHVEHGTWLAICDHLRDNYQIEVNAESNDVLVKMIEMWGENLAALRHEQSNGQREEALQRRRVALTKAQDA